MQRDRRVIEHAASVTKVGELAPVNQSTPVLPRGEAEREDGDDAWPKGKNHIVRRSAAPHARPIDASPDGRSSASFRRTFSLTFASIATVSCCRTASLSTTPALNGKPGHCFCYRTRLLRKAF